MNNPKLITPGSIYVGKCSYFGGPLDTGVGLHEGLALMSFHDRSDPEFAWLFNGTANVGDARALNPSALYCAMRWNYNQSSRNILRQNAMVEVKSNATGKTVHVKPVDWGPALDTGRVIDLSPGAIHALGVETDALVTVQLIVMPTAVERSVFQP